MNKKNVRFAFVVSALCLGFLSDAVAAPSVKRLGGAKTYVGTDKAVSAKSGVSTKTAIAGERTSTIQTNRSKTAETVSGVKSVSGFSDTSRLSVGKYLHNAGVSAGIIKPISGSVVTPSEVSSLTNRIEYLETGLNNVSNTVSELDATVSVLSEKIAAVEEAASSEKEFANDWETQRPIWE